MPDEEPTRLYIESALVWKIGVTLLIVSSMSSVVFAIVHNVMAHTTSAHGWDDGVRLALYLGRLEIPAENKIPLHLEELSQDAGIAENPHWDKS